MLSLLVLLIFHFISFIGYAPGQTVNVSVNINNTSSSEVTDLEVQLNKVRRNLNVFFDINEILYLCYFVLQQITFHGRANEAYHYGESRNRVVNETIREKMISGCDAKSKTTATVDIHVPAIPPSDFATSNIVKVHYTIRVS